MRRSLPLPHSGQKEGRVHFGSLALQARHTIADVPMAWPLVRSRGIEPRPVLDALMIRQVIVHRVDRTFVGYPLLAAIHTRDGGTAARVDIHAATFAGLLTVRPSAGRPHAERGHHADHFASVQRVAPGSWLRQDHRLATKPRSFATGSPRAKVRIHVRRQAT